MSTEIKSALQVPNPTYFEKRYVMCVAYMALFAVGLNYVYKRVYQWANVQPRLGLPKVRPGSGRPDSPGRPARSESYVYATI